MIFRITVFYVLYFTVIGEVKKNQTLRTLGLCPEDEGVGHFRSQESHEPKSVAQECKVPVWGGLP